MEPAQLHNQNHSPGVGLLESQSDIQARVLRFTIGSRCFGVLASAVMEVSPPLEVTPLPFASDFLSGIALLRGEIVAVMNLAASVGVAIAQDPAKSKYIILNALIADDSMPIAFAVERVGDVCNISAMEAVQPCADSSPFIVGIVNSHSPPTEILDHRMLPRVITRSL
jgi:chemotaxis signal transduction protein